MKFGTENTNPGIIIVLILSVKLKYDMNTPQSFKDLIYSEENKQTYIGMGNPNARILIIGREPNHDLATEDGRNGFEQDQQLNRDNWKYLIEDRPVIGRCNPRRPFPNQRCLINNGHNDGTATTWVWYQKLVDLILGREYERAYSLRPLDFHDYCFHTDISSAAAPGLAMTDRTTKAASVVERSKQLFGHPFFKQFPIVILGIGTDVGQYVPLEWCEKVLGFPTNEVINIQEKPMIWLNGDSANGRVLVHTHCLSQTSYEYINKIREVIWENCLSDYCWPKAY